MTKLKQMQSMAADLKTLSEEFGFQPRFIPDQVGFTVVFENDARGVFWPLELSVDWTKSSSGSGWNLATLLIDNMLESEIGHNGWKAYRSAQVNMVGLEGGKAGGLAAVSSVMEWLEPIPLRTRDISGVTFNTEFAQALYAIKEAAASIPDVFIECDRHAWTESYKFSDQSGRRYLIAFAERAALYVDGVKAGETRSDRPEEIARIVSEAIASPEAKMALPTRTVR
jgi:hypothetical protein